MRIPNRIQEHPIEAAIASLLLLTVLFGSVDFKPAASRQNSRQIRWRKNSEIIGGPERNSGRFVLLAERTSDPERPQPLRQPASGVRSLLSRNRNILSVQGVLPCDRLFGPSSR